MNVWTPSLLPPFAAEPGWGEAGGWDGGAGRGMGMLTVFCHQTAVFLPARTMSIPFDGVALASGIKSAVDMNRVKC